MKEYLEKHIKDIFNSLGIKVPFKVYNCNVDTLPDWTKQIQLTNEFIVYCHDISLKQRLQVFTGKNIFQYENFIYWFEGNRIVTLENVKIKVIDNNNKNIKCLKTNTRLPSFLDDFIYNQLRAIYAPNFQRFDYNLNLTNEDILKYLGTYFPRSYAESFCIFDNIFQNKEYQQAISKKSILNILSVGSGTGGDIIGLIIAIEKYFQQVSKINIYAIDGNFEALTILIKLVDNFRNHTSKIININTIKSIFSSVSDITSDKIITNEFDFILSFKLICEIITMDNENNNNSYYDFIIKFLPMLKKNGLCILLDVTTKSNHTRYNPILMNRQVNQALRELDNYKSLLPISCNIYEKQCYFDCFNQQIFTVTHQKQTNDKSKVTYRVIGHNDLVNKIVSNANDSKLLVNNRNICPHTVNYLKTEDAYFLKQSYKRIKGELKEN